MIIERTVDPVFGMNTYCIIENRHDIFIDPVFQKNFQDVVGENTVDFAVLTHEHYDHIRSVNELRRESFFMVCCGEKAVPGMYDSKVNMSRYIDFLRQFIPFGSGEISACDYSCKADRLLKDGEILFWENHRLLIKETPGHSAGSISMLLDDKYLFSGDAIFRGYPTATRLPGGSTNAFKTITEPWLDSLPQDVMVYPGHTEPFPLGERYKKSH